MKRTVCISWPKAIALTCAVLSGAGSAQAGMGGSSAGQAGAGGGGGRGTGSGGTAGSTAGTGGGAVSNCQGVAWPTADPTSAGPFQVTSDKNVGPLAGVVPDPVY